MVAKPKAFDLGAHHNYDPLMAIAKRVPNHINRGKEK
jgi:hypothetical protein